MGNDWSLTDYLSGKELRKRPRKEVRQQLKLLSSRIHAMIEVNKWKVT